MKTKIGLLTLGALVLPVVSFAQGFGAFTTLATDFGGIVNILLPVIFTLGLLVFFWGLVRYIFGQDHDKEVAKKTMLWGVVALFVMASVWGLVAFLRATFGITAVNTATVPTVVVP